MYSELVLNNNEQFVQKFTGLLALLLIRYVQLDITTIILDLDTCTFTSTLSGEQYISLAV